MTFMPNTLVLVTFGMDSGLPEDVSVNTWSFTTELASDVPTAQAIAPVIQGFYQPLQAYLSPAIANVVTLRFYERDDPEPRIPYYNTSFSINTGAGEELPSEIALCLSFHGEPVSGLPAARRRGRIYIGPLGGSAAPSSGPSRPVQAFIDLIRTRALAVKAASAASGGIFQWTVWSTSDAAPVPITGGWIDNAFDVQRRRGLAATARNTWV